MSMMGNVLGVSEAEHGDFLRQFDDDPFPFYAALREMGSVVQDPVTGGYHVNGRDEIELALKSWEIFSSAPMSVMSPFFGRNLFELDGAEHARVRGLIRASF